MHPTQQHILSVLKHQSPRRYRDLKPSDVDGNTFMHHLRTLISDGLVTHENDQYSLTLPGKQLVDSWSTATYTPRQQPKIMVEVVYANEKGEWLLVEQTTEPFRGYIGFPCGRLHISERLEAAAKRELQEQTGFTAKKLDYYGSIAMETRVEDKTINHLLTHIFRATAVTGKLIQESKVGKPFFSSLENLHKDKIFPGLHSVIARINRTSCELTDEVFTMSL
jgi:ADP-ribose pyrophosphatase YjhB (NUDIX family)